MKGTNSVLALISVGISMAAAMGPLANAGTYALTDGESVTIFPNTSTTVTCSASGGGSGPLVDVASNVDAECVDNFFVYQKAFPMDRVVEFIDTCRSGSLDPAKCTVISTTSNTQCIAKAKKVQTANGWEINGSWDLQAATAACMTKQAKCRF